MSIMKYTPWEIEGPEGDLPPEWIIRNQRYESVAYVHTIEEACLISAAPELLAALEACLVSMNHAKVFIGSKQKMHPEGQKLWIEDIERASAAIMRAKVAGTKTKGDA